MLTRAQNKHIRSLTQQKFRNEYKEFIAEGEKIAAEWLKTNEPIKMILATEEWADFNSRLIERHPEAQVHILKARGFASLTAMQSPNGVILVLPIPQPREVPVSNEWYLALDDIQDPGNMGTILRIADWFGIKHVVCSPSSVDVYNPKVVQSAMGAHLRTCIYESDLESFLSATTLPKYAATLDGENVYNMQRQDAGILIIGNESRGISEIIKSLATKKITIPRKGGAESLNAGVSTGIMCALLLPC
ncbi:MAG: tRNA/rRNA methyltransferase (SpoU) [Flavipsychrobacter sp.]|jgi:TrmH family RNA methyltransferase|nr:tRNA/rRNA methyltransferase (SpoU) [Flavipsychrobacter sp.]